jgi:XTP/dITP diphosphohydrolase
MRAGPVLETVLYADDLAAAVMFYGKVLGLPLQKEQTGRFAFFRCGEQMLLLFNPMVTEKQSGPESPPAHGARGPGHVCFRASRAELEQWKEHFSRQGIAVERVIDWPDGGRSLYVRDPVGNSVEFAEPAIWGFTNNRSLRGQKILIATHNKGKLEEFREILAPHGVDVTSAGELNLAEPAETENTFEGNARIKAKAAMEASGLITIADDSGLCVDALGGAPGVYTADWAGPSRDWMMAMRTVEEKLQAAGAVTPEQRGASFNCTLLILWPNGHERIYVGRAPGHLSWPPKGQFGHGYDPVFVPVGFDISFGQMANEQKNKISHRARALEKLLKDLL